MSSSKTAIELIQVKMYFIFRDLFLLSRMLMMIRTRILMIIRTWMLMIIQTRMLMMIIVNREYWFVCDVEMNCMCVYVSWHTLAWTGSCMVRAPSEEEAGHFKASLIYIQGLLYSSPFFSGSKITPFVSCLSLDGSLLKDTCYGFKVKTAKINKTDCVNLGTHLVTSSFKPASFNSITASYNKVLKRWFITWVTGQSVQKLQIFAILA